MATIYREFDLPIGDEEAWQRIADVSAVGSLIDFLGPVSVEGDQRTCSLGEQGALNELIVTVDPSTRRLVYSIVESPFNFTHHSASWSLVPNGEGTTFQWVTDFKPDAVGSELEGVIDEAVESIRRSLSGR